MNAVYVILISSKGMAGESIRGIFKDEHKARKEAREMRKKAKKCFTNILVKVEKYWLKDLL